jgi:TRAP transporter 4TM/12TM fusion protein
VHLEALKANMTGLPQRATPLKARLIGWSIALVSLSIIVSAAAWSTELLPMVFGDGAGLAAGALVAAVYVGLVWFSSRYPELSLESADAMQREVPQTGPTVLAGVFYLVPIFVLVWCLMALERSPGTAAFYACASMMFMLVTQRPLIAFFRKRPLAGTWKSGFADLHAALHAGGHNMIGIAIATAAAGFIVGSVSLTGIGQVMSELVETISGGSMFGILLLTAVFSMVLGMGLPTTPNYIVVASLLAPVIYQLAATHGLDVSLFAVHLFVFYFGIMADATPPVALAAFAAAGLSGADPMKTGVQGFIYELRTAVLPFVFIFNPELLLFNVGSPLHLAWALFSAVAACLVLASAIQGWLLTRCRLWESALLLLAVIPLFRPDLLRDWHTEPYRALPTAMLERVVHELPRNANLRLRIEVGQGSQTETRTVVLSAGKEGEPQQRISRTGLHLERRGRELWVAYVDPGSPADKLRISAEDNIRVIGPEVRNKQPDKNLYTLPGFALVLLVGALQLMRRR